MSRASVSHAGRSGNPNLGGSNPEPAGSNPGPVNPMTLILTPTCLCRSLALGVSLVNYVLVIVCTDLSSKEPHRQVSMGRVITSGSPGGIMVSTLAWYASDVGLIPALGAIFPIFIIHTILVAMATILYKPHYVWLLNLSCMCRSLAVCNCKY